MTELPEDLCDLERDAARVVGMICREDVPAARLDLEIAALRRKAELVFPGRPELFDLTYGRRFRRLRTRFRPSPRLIEARDVASDAAPGTAP